MNKYIKKYLKNCRKLFPFYGKKERIFLSRLEETMKGDEEDDLSYESLIKRFGQPTLIISSYYEQEDCDYLIKKANIYKILKGCVFLAIVFIFIFLCYRCYIIKLEFDEIQNSSNGYFIEEIQ